MRSRRVLDAQWTEILTVERGYISHNISSKLLTRAKGLCTGAPDPSSSGQDYVAALCHSSFQDYVAGARNPSSFGQDYVAYALPFILSGLRRWRSVFLFPTTGYLTGQSKSTFCCCRTSFFAWSSPLREQALDGRVPYEKSTQLSLSAFALVCDPDRIRTCDPQLRRLLLYPAELPDQSIFCVSQMTFRE